MKNLILITAYCLLFTIYSFAQKNTFLQKWQIGVQMNTIDKLPAISTLFPDGMFTFADGRRHDKSYSLGITINYFLKDNFSLRMRVDYLKRDVIQDAGVSVVDSAAIANNNNEIEHAEITEQNFYFAPGVQWNYYYKKLNLYFGFQAPVNIYDKITVDYLLDGYNYMSSPHIIVKTLETTDKATIPSGYSYGIGTFLGGGVSFGKHFLISTELSTDFLFYSIMAKGNTHFHAIYTYYYPKQPETVVDEDEDYTTVNNDVLNFKGTIKLSYKF